MLLVSSGTHVTYLKIGISEAYIAFKACNTYDQRKKTNKILQTYQTNIFTGCRKSIGLSYLSMNSHVMMAFPDLVIPKDHLGN